VAKFRVMTQINRAMIHQILAPRMAMDR